MICKITAIDKTLANGYELSPKKIVAEYRELNFESQAIFLRKSLIVYRLFIRALELKFKNASE